MRDHPLRQQLEQALTAAQQPSAKATMLRVDADDARLQLEHVLAHPDSGTLPLRGQRVAVKDLFDVAGQVTAAGSALLGQGLVPVKPAPRDAAVLTHLRQAGAVVVGRSNMSEFAYSGVGINPHHGTPINPADPQVHRVPGGSSSGAAVAVALDIADIGLGTDTGGSLRIPAALCGLVGFKGTAGVVSRQGCFPLSTTLDTVGAITRNVADAIAAHRVMAQQPTPLTAPRPRRLGIAARYFQEAMDDGVSLAWERALRALTSAGHELVTLDLPELDEIHALNARGTLSAAESFALHRPWLQTHRDAYDPRVLARILGGEHTLAADYLDLVRARTDWLQRTSAAIAGVDAMLAPTTPMVAPILADIAPGEARDEAFNRANMRLLRNPSAINLLDGCALSLPCQAPGELPVGLMVWQAAQLDAQVLSVAAELEAALQPITQAVAT
ncbi:MAG: amidase [Proteobacteria bacterium]|nr:amidase [Pseudomonadota bacterium]MDA0868664.1 amidase [Pseudomonadota bacterium]MDA1327715.1 amidase [Pseudomonadota bacterium]